MGGRLVMLPPRGGSAPLFRRSGNAGPPTAEAGGAAAVAWGAFAPPTSRFSEVEMR
jgi:hypothetical protein